MDMCSKHQVKHVSSAPLHRLVELCRRCARPLARQPPREPRRQAPNIDRQAFMRPLSSRGARNERAAGTPHAGLLQPAACSLSRGAPHRHQQVWCCCLGGVPSSLGHSLAGVVAAQRARLLGRAPLGGEPPAAGGPPRAACAAAAGSTGCGRAGRNAEQGCNGRGSMQASTESHGAAHRRPPPQGQTRSPVAGPPGQRSQLPAG
jgi:hypothetical protein